MKLRLLLLALIHSAAFAQVEPKEILLWPEGAPGSEGKTAPEKITASANGERQVSSIHKPSIMKFRAAKETATGAAVLVIPGGGHKLLCLDHEGENVARWLAAHGIMAFVLKHRLAREEGSTYTVQEHALADTRRALRLIRSRAGLWKIDPARVGAMGFSAGGQLVALAALSPGEGQADAADLVERENARPSFQALIYPGNSAAIVPAKDTPPAFLVCGDKDRTDISEGLAEAYLRFRRAGASAELHIYAGVGHGFGLRAETKGALVTWPERFADWLNSRAFLSFK